MLGSATQVIGRWTQRMSRSLGPGTGLGIQTCEQDYGYTSQACCRESDSPCIASRSIRSISSRSPGAQLLYWSQSPLSASSGPLVTLELDALGAETLVLAAALQDKAGL
jgi:hypothetical protein